MPIPMNWHIIFLHIQKTGGTTLDTILRRNLGDLQNNSILFEPELIKKNKSAIIRGLSDIQSPSYIRGVVGYGISDYISGRCQYVTLLRHPVKRVLSLYYYLSNYPQSPSYTKVKDMSLEEFLFSRITPDVTDGQTRQLASKDGFQIPLEQNLTSADLERAKRRIKEKSIIFGITDEFDKSLLLLAYELGLKKITYKKRNVSRYRRPLSEIPERVLRKIERQNSYDLLLYDYAWQIFHAAIEKFGEKFSNELSHFRSDQERFQSNYMEDYTEYGKAKIQLLNNELNNMGNKRIAIYGAGEHTERMMEDTVLLNKNIVAIIDSKIFGRSFNGLRIISPSELSKYEPEIVIVSSFTFQEEIVRFLLEDMNYKGEIMRIYSEGDTQPFYSYRVCTRSKTIARAIL